MLFGFSNVGTAKNITNYYLCVRALKNELKNDAAFMYLGLVILNYKDIKKGKISLTNLEDACISMIEHCGYDPVEYVCGVVHYATVLMIQARGAGFREAYDMAYTNTEKIDKIVAETMNKCNPGVIFAAVKTLLESNDPLFRIPDVFNDNVIYFD